MDKTTFDGLVIKSISGFFTVQAGDEQIIARIPGRLRKQKRGSTLIAIGDSVTVSVNADGSGSIEAIAPRKSALARARTAAGVRTISADLEQVLVANPDQVVFVFSVTTPSPSFRKLDRFLVVAEMNGLTAVICANKTDLTSVEEAREQFKLYEQIGYRVIYTSAESGEGVEELRDCLHNKISALTGSSGVGKSSLLNAIQPELGLQALAVSQATGKGMHTTRYAEMFPLEGGGYVADTPGIRGLALFDLEPGELDAYFVEIEPLVAQCRFSDCTHIHEPGCAVLKGVKNGTVSPQRYDSYLRLREEHEILEKKFY